MNYIRKINQKFINDLLVGELKELLAIIKNDKALQLEIRNGYISVYYLGGNLLKVTQKAKSYRFEFDLRYCFDENDKRVVEQVKTDNNWVKNIPTLKIIMTKWHNAKYDKQERKIQQNFCRDNMASDSHYFVIDMEYQTGKESRVDMLGLSRNGEKINIVLIELKQGYNSISGKAGLKKHYLDLTRLIKNCSTDLTETVRNIYANKVALGLIPDCYDLSKRMDFEILFVLYDYNDKSIQFERALNEIRELNENISFACQKIPKGIFTL
ncbi:MAG: hypothetical protein FWE84_04845 [Firmicutes bacterium]|nr:hypothetical protein [Bacillota bacterium]